LWGSNDGSVKHGPRALGLRDESVNGQDMQGLHTTRKRQMKSLVTGEETSRPVARRLPP